MPTSEENVKGGRTLLPQLVLPESGVVVASSQGPDACHHVSGVTLAFVRGYLREVLANQTSLRSVHFKADDHGVELDMTFRDPLESTSIQSRSVWRRILDAIANNWRQFAKILTLLMTLTASCG